MLAFQQATLPEGVLPTSFNLERTTGSTFAGYGVFNQMQAYLRALEAPIAQTKNEKRLVEELIPLARYVQAPYPEGRRIRGSVGC